MTEIDEIEARIKGADGISYLTTGHVVTGETAEPDMRWLLTRVRELEAEAAQVERDARFGRAIRDAMATHDAAASIVKAAEHYIREEAGR
jgi:hypothetical protein